MSNYVMGEQIQFGVGLEATRGTPVAPQMWIPARTPSGIITVIDKVQIRETRGTGIAGQGSEIGQSRAEGDLEYNVRASSIGYIFLSLLGNVSTNYANGAGVHTFTRQLTGPQNPSLTAALAQPGVQHYQYPMAVVNNIELSIPIDDVVNATSTFMSTNEIEHSDYIPAFLDDSIDPLFRNHDVTIQIADNVAGLAAAPAVCIKQFDLSINNNSINKLCLGNRYPTDILSIASEITGSFSADFEGVEEYYDVFKDGAYKAIRVTVERQDMPIIGTSALKPKMVITLPKIAYDSYSADRSIDSIVEESIEFSANYDENENSAITVELTNAIQAYTAGLPEGS